MTYRPLWRDAELPAELEAKVQALLGELAPTAVERDTEYGHPEFEAAAIRRSGIASLVVGASDLLDAPADNYGADLATRWNWVTNIISRIARVDAGAAALYGYHSLHSLRVALTGHHGLTQEAYNAIASGKVLLGGANNPAGVVSATVEKVDGGYVLNGRKNYASGAATADLLIVSENVNNDSGQSRITFLLDARSDGITHHDNWDGIGAVRTASGSIEFVNTFVPEDRVLDCRTVSTCAPAPNEVEALSHLGFQVLFVSLLSGYTQGAIEAARDIVATKIKKSGRQPALAHRLGQDVANTAAATALVRQAVSEFAQAVVAADSKELSDDELLDVSDALSRAKTIASQTATQVTSGLLTYSGGSGATRSKGLDRFWRNAVTFTLHDPLDARIDRVGLLALREGQ